MNRRHKHFDRLRQQLPRTLQSYHAAIRGWLGKTSPTKARLKVMRFVQASFPKTIEEETEKNIPRGTYNPPRRSEIISGVNLDERTADDTIDYCTTMGFIAKTYRYGTKEYTAQRIVGGQVVMHLSLVGLPPIDTDPSDASWGFDCYQLTNKGAEYIKQRRQLLRWLFYEHYKAVLTIIGTIIGGLILAYYKLK